MHENGLLANSFDNKETNEPHLSCVGGSAPVASAVAVVTCSQQRWPVGGLLLGNRVNAGHPPWHRPLEHVLRGGKKRFNPNILPLPTFSV